MTPPKKGPEKIPAAAPIMLAREGEEPKPLPEKAPEKGIGGRIKEARERPVNGLSIEALSRLCKMIDPVGQGIAQQTIVKYEKGIVLPGARELRILCDALVVTADWLIFGVERAEKGSVVIPVEDAMSVLIRMIRDRLVKENPIALIAPQADVVRQMLLAKAREPTPRK